MEEVHPFQEREVEVEVQAHQPSQETEEVVEGEAAVEALEPCLDLDSFELPLNTLSRRHPDSLHSRRRDTSHPDPLTNFKNALTFMTYH